MGIRQARGHVAHGPLEKRAPKSQMLLSMTGKERYMSNILVERLWCTLKDYPTVPALYSDLGT